MEGYSKKSVMVLKQQTVLLQIISNTTDYLQKIGQDFANPIRGPSLPEATYILTTI